MFKIACATLVGMISARGSFAVEVLTPPSSSKGDEVAIVWIIGADQTAGDYKDIA